MDSNIDFLENFHPGPLDAYRNLASFNWKEMAVTIENSESVKFKHKIWKVLSMDPLFARPQGILSFEEYRSLTMQRLLKILEYNFLPEDKMLASPNLGSAFTIALQQYDGSLSAKRSILIDFFTNAIRGLGTARHYEFLEAAASGKIFGCVAITEVGHGSNTRGLKTTATFDVKTQTFVLNTPDFLAAKCWPGNLGKTATYACVTAKLITPMDECQGLANFLVPIRDPTTMLPYPGVIIADLGPKIGVNGLDNGLLIFQNYAIPRESLLNKTGDVIAEGKFVTQNKFSDPTKRFGASLGNLSAARAGLIPMISQLICDALTIGIRYSCVRRQFGGNEEEIPIIEYQTQQYRLIPYLAAGYVLKYFGHSIFDTYVSYLFKSFSEPDKEVVKMMGTEIHILSSAAKPLVSWIARDAIQEVRECCGGHGYLHISGIGTLRNDNDANLTHEGDNHVLIQQTSNYLLNLWTNGDKDQSYDTPLKTLSFLSERRNVSSRKFTAKTHSDLINPVTILTTFKWLLCRLIESTSEKYGRIFKQGKNAFVAKNDSQIFYAKPLSIVFIEHYVLEHFWLTLLQNTPKLDKQLYIVLEKVMCLYGLWSLEKYLSIFYQWGYMKGPQDANLLRESILCLCKELKSEAVALVDAVAPPDFILNSVLGTSDGEVYKHLQNRLLQTPGAFERDRNWEKVAKHLTQSKL